MHRIGTLGNSLLMASSIAAIWPAGAAAEGSCFVQCVESCSLKPSTGEAKAPTPPAFVKPCRDAALANGTAEVVFRSRGKEQSILLTEKDRPFGDSLRLFDRLDCFGHEKNTCDAGPSTVVAILAKRFDPADPWVPIGDPCKLGFPCDWVRVPRGAWRMRLVDPSMSGKFRVAAVRGTARETVVAIRDGMVELPAQWLQGGQSYRYQWISTDDKVAAAGEFRTLSAPMQHSIDAQADGSRAAPGGEVRSLIENHLDWEALQVTLGNEQPR